MLPASKIWLFNLSCLAQEEEFMDQEIKKVCLIILRQLSLLFWFQLSKAEAEVSEGNEDNESLQDELIKEEAVKEEAKAPSSSKRNRGEDNL